MMGPGRRVPSLPSVILALAAVLIATGIILHGVGVITLRRVWLDLIERPDQRMAFRFILQPAMSVSLAIRDGIRDARAGRPPFFWSVVTEPGKRLRQLHEGLAATGRVVLLAMVLDTVFQILVYRTFYPSEAVIVAVLLGYLPYVIFRGPAARVAYRRLTSSAIRPNS